MDENLKNKLTPFHKSLHLPENPQLGYNHPVNHVYTPFLYSFDKTSLYQHSLEELKYIEEDGKYDYLANMNYDGISYITLEVELPTIILKKPKKSNIVHYEGKWIKNIASNIVKSLQIKLNDHEFNSLTPVYFDSYAEGMLTKSEKEVYYTNINHSSDWSDCTIKETLIFFIPVFHALFHNTYFPLYLCGLQDKFRYIFDFNLNIAELYQIQAISQDGIKENIPFSKKTVQSVNGVNFQDNLKLNLPKLKGSYLKFNSDDYQYLINFAHKNYFFNAVKYYKSEQTKKLGEQLSIDIPKEIIPHTYIWVAKNTKDFSNYQADGYSPISESTLTLSDVKKLSYIDTQKIHPLKHFNSQPKPGFNLWTNGFRAKDNGPIPEDEITKLEVKLENLNPYINIKHDLNQLPNEDEFQLELLLLYTKKITFNSYPKNKEERKTISAEITISY